MRTTINHGNGVQTVVALEDGALHSGTVQDCTPIAERAKAMHNAGHHGSNTMRLAATLPDVMVEAYCNRLGITFSDFMRDRAHVRSMLNDPALAHFRVWPGKV